MQAVKSLADGELPAMRFQLSESQTWIETQGRIAWISASKKAAGVEFVGLPEEARNKIRQWIPLRLHPNGSAQGNPLGEKFEPVRDVLPTWEPESAISVPEPETTGRADEHVGRHSIAEEPAGALPSAAETRDFETVSRYVRATSAKPVAAENTSRETRLPRYLSYEKTKRIRHRADRDPTSRARMPRQWIGVLVLVLLVSTLFFLGIHFRNTGNSQQSREVPATASQPVLPSNDSVIKNPPISTDPKQPVDRLGFVLQVGAMTHKVNADALTELLRKKNFPAFVSQRGSDRFYRVVVGPYHDANSTSKVKEELRKQDLDAIRLQWSP
jgi:hypothetical protein